MELSRQGLFLEASVLLALCAAPEALWDRGAVYLWFLLAEPRLSHPELHQSEGRQVLPDSFLGSDCCGLHRKCVLTQESHPGRQKSWTWTCPGHGQDAAHGISLALPWACFVPRKPLPSHSFSSAERWAENDVLQLTQPQNPDTTQ